MQEPSSQPKKVRYDLASYTGGAEALTAKQSAKLAELHKQANIHDPICRQAPIIWDGETREDINYAKNACRGRTENGKQVSDPCPILNLCAETAIVINVTYGVWGSLSPSDRRRFNV